MKNLKQRVFNLIRDDDKNDLAGNIFDGGIIFFIAVSIVQVVAETFSLPGSWAAASKKVEAVTVVVFTVEYLARIWTATFIHPDKGPVLSRVKYALTPMALIDLAAILPFYIPFIIHVDLRVLRTLRMVRLLRIFKANRYTDALSKISRVLRNKASQLLSSVFIVCLLMIISAVLMYDVENAAQPDTFNNAFSALWWAVATFTTVGYGDIYPVTILGKVLSGVIALLGIGLVAVPTGIISAGFIEEIDNKKPAENMSQFCLHCGKKLRP